MIINMFKYLCDDTNISSHLKHVQYQQDNMKILLITWRKKLFF
jgi:hypothetical protein